MILRLEWTMAKILRLYFLIFSIACSHCLFNILPFSTRFFYKGLLQPLLFLFFLMNKNTLLFPSHLHFISSLMFLELYLHWFFKRKGYFINWNVQDEYPLHPNLSKAKIKAKIRRYNKKWTSKDSAWWYPLLSFDQVVLATLFASLNFYSDL